MDDTVSTEEDTPVTLEPLTNDLSPSGSPLTIVSTTDGQNGHCSIEGGNEVTYTPNAGFDGTDVCLYTVCDQNNLCDEAVSCMAVMSLLQLTGGEMNIS